MADIHQFVFLYENFKATANALKNPEPPPLTTGSEQPPVTTDNIDDDVDFGVDNVEIAFSVQADNVFV